MWPTGKLVEHFGRENCSQPIQIFELKRTKVEGGISNHLGDQVPATAAAALGFSVVASFAGSAEACLALAC